MEKWKMGTPLCGVLCAVLGVLLALMLLFLGFWRTLFVAVLACAGYLIGATENKSEALRQLINKCFPPKGE